MKLDRRDLAQHISRQLAAHSVRVRAQWSATGPINHFVLDNLLPEAWALAIRASFPSPDSMTLKRSLRELKYVTAQMNRFAPLLEEAVYAFQDPEIVREIESITGLKELEPDSLLYAGGISLMSSGHFLNPHVDNSHDKFRERYRVLNLLYYVSPDWREDNGGNLELWPAGPSKQPLTIVSEFNRLVVMVTHQGSWHSVSRSNAKEDRCCVSNYYFSHRPVGESDYFHVTSFRGRPEQRLRDWVLRGDIWLRMHIRMLFPKGIRNNPHYYRREP
ncbi:MAG TPA: 2OG-Fe(II) oxygenase [Steroidobacteraceae bacterium]|nr:2OG-Fe(II) oxygenase [Steroidobacteraceae bacterium]